MLWNGKLKIAVILLTSLSLESAWGRNPLPKTQNTKKTGNLCDVLKRPNSLLLNRFLKIKIQRICKKNKGYVPTKRSAKKGKACWYKVPESWAKSIKYPKLHHTGIMLRTKNTGKLCPTVSYSMFENITFDGHYYGTKDGSWKTKQTNRLGRFLRIKRKKAPVGAPIKITAGGKYNMTYLKFGSLLIPLAQNVSRDNT